MRTWWRRICALGVVVAATAVLFAVAAGGSSAATAKSAAASTACVPPPPSKLPNDPDGVAATLTGAAKAAMGGKPAKIATLDLYHTRLLPLLVRRLRRDGPGIRLEIESTAVEEIVEELEEQEDMSVLSGGLAA